ncbi:MAG TPA: radical SAM protein [bacterium]|nr:radical SAM protein [bacterium]
MKGASGKKADTLRVKEIYPAIMGESSWAGLPGVIVRLAGCNLRCSYCDTTYAYYGGRSMAVDRVVTSVMKHGLRRVLVTGGEPLLEPAAVDLMEALIKRRLAVELETNGSISLEPVPRAVHVVMDFKSPGSGCVDQNRWENLLYLKPTDEIKFVLTGLKDYLWAKDMIKRLDLDRRFQLILSPAFSALNPAILARWMLRDRLNARLGLQIHKYIYGAKARRV